MCTLRYCCDTVADPNNVYDELIHPHHIIFPGDEIPKRKKKIKKRPPIKVEELENYISTKQENDCEELRKEYRVSDGGGGLGLF